MPFLARRRIGIADNLLAQLHGYPNSELILSVLLEYAPGIKSPYNSGFTG
jgi:hypothetical protein